MAIHRALLYTSRVTAIMADPLLIYGATGHTGRLITLEALRLGLRPVLGGRNAAALAALSAELGLPYRVARLDHPHDLDEALRDVSVVIHTAGPFLETAQPMLQACLRTAAHYLDITGEVLVFDALAQSDDAARAREIMIMPGVGFDVVPSDCLAAHVARRVPGATHLTIGVKGLVLATRGSAKTMVSYAGTPPMVRREGMLVAVTDEWRERWFDFGEGPERSLCVVWGDVAAAYYTTGIPNIEVYFEAAPLREALARANRTLGWVLQLPAWQTWMRTLTEILPDAPAAYGEESDTLIIVAEATAADGRRFAARMRTPQAYATTAMTAAEIARRVVAGDLEVGFQTPGRVYGPDFALRFPGVERVDL